MSKNKTRPEAEFRQINNITLAVSHTSTTFNTHHSYIQFENNKKLKHKFSYIYPWLTKVESCILIKVESILNLGNSEFFLIHPVKKNSSYVFRNAWKNPK